MVRVRTKRADIVEDRRVPCLTIRSQIMNAN